MHIVFVTVELASEDNSGGGMASFIANMARIFYQRGHKVSIILSTTKENQMHFDNQVNLYKTFVKIDIWRKFDKISKLFSKISKINNDDIRRALINYYRGSQVKRVIKKIISEEKIDIVHYCNHVAFSLWAIKKIPYVVRISGFNNLTINSPNASLRYEDNPVSLKDKLEIKALKKSKYVISPSNLYADICMESLNVYPKVLESPYLINSHVWDWSIYNQLDIGNNKYILHFGRMDYAKGIHVVAEMSRKFLEKYDSYYLILIGNSLDIMDEKGDIIKAHELVLKKAGEYSNRVIYTGAIAKEQLLPVIQNAELCIFPSRFENLSNACIESMAMGKIVVATNGASFEQLIDDGISGFLCERDNPDSFLKAVEKVLRMSDADKKVVSENARKVTERLAPDKVYENYLEYYTKVINEWNG